MNYKEIADNYFKLSCEMIDFENGDNTTQDWLRLRMKGIGGSDVPCILGHSRFKNRKDIYRSKLVEQEEISNSAIEYGNYFEDLIFKEFAFVYKDIYETLNYKTIMFRNYFKPYLQASVDGVLVEKATNKVGLLEIKTTQRKKSKWYENGERSIPQDYIDQAIHYFNVTNVDFVVFYPKINMIDVDYSEYDSVMLRPRRIDREDCLEYMKEVENECQDFWNNYVDKGIEPSNRIVF